MTSAILSTNGVYWELLRKMLADGMEFSPRGMLTKEVGGVSTTVSMTNPIVTNPERRLDYRFMAAEAYWILSGSSELNHPSLVKNLKKYSDDGVFMRGAYGPPFREQLDYCVRVLDNDPYTRQAVMTLWRPNPIPSKDIPCTVSMQFLMREGYINTMVFMRSSDAWLGWPYDVFNFTMMTMFLQLKLKTLPKLGLLKIMVGSQHLYERHFRDAERLLKDGGGDILLIKPHGINTPDLLLDVLDIIRNCPSDVDPLTIMRNTLCQPIQPNQAT
jgi:thymidylate synthase